MPIKKSELKKIITATNHNADLICTIKLSVPISSEGKSPADVVKKLKQLESAEVADILGLTGSINHGDMQFELVKIEVKNVQKDE